MFFFAETLPVHQPATQLGISVAGSGMPTAVAEDSLRFNVTAATADMNSMRHQGPQPGPGGSHQPFLVDTQPPQQSFSTGYQTPTVPVISAQTPSSVHQPSPGMTLAPTVYIKYCNKCSWHSIPTTDGAAYSGAVSDLESHKKEAHPETKDGGEFSTKSKDSDEYKLATTLREVQACQDDGVNNFCPVRFWRAPMSWKNSQLALPLEQSPVCPLGDFEPFGLEVNNRKLIRDLHSLGFKSPKLSDFSDVNLKGMIIHSFV
jgi:hypothetical protein